jgi:hypothetical protein
VKRESGKVKALSVRDFARTPVYAGAPTRVNSLPSSSGQAATLEIGM